MHLLLPERSIALRRGSGVAIATTLHLLAVGLLVVVSLVEADAPARVRAVEVTPVPPLDETPSPSHDDVLTDRQGDQPDAAYDVSGVAIGDLLFDIAKIRARSNALFPFLTVDLKFLESVRAQVDKPPQRLLNPLGPGAVSHSLPLLLLEDGELQRVVDRAWSRRHRWKTFSEIAEITSTHDPDTGRVAEVLRAYLDQNILQPFCDQPNKDPRFWAMLENAADHADFIDFVRSFARSHPSSRATTELLFLLDELAQASRDALLTLLDTNVDVELRYTASKAPDGHQLALALQERYLKWLADRAVHTREPLARRYDDLRLRLLATIFDTTPDGYRAGDARFLAGEIAFKQGNVPAAMRWWRDITPAATDLCGSLHAAARRDRSGWWRPRHRAATRD